MKKFSYLKLFAGAALAGAAAATAYTFVKRYRELAVKPLPDNENSVEAKPEIDMEAAKQAAFDTYDVVKKQTGRAVKTISQSTKAVGTVIMDNYGDDIAEAKEVAGVKLKEAKEYAGVKLQDAKVYASEKFAEAKEYAGEKVAQAKEYVQGKYDEFAKNNPKVDEILEDLKDTAERTYTTVKEKVAGLAGSIKATVEAKPEEEAPAEPAEEPVHEAEPEMKPEDLVDGPSLPEESEGETIVEVVEEPAAEEESAEEPEKKSEDFIQNL